MRELTHGSSSNFHGGTDRLRLTKAVTGHRTPKELSPMQTFWQDLRYGARMLVKTPAVTLVAVIALTLGIGANTALFSVVNAVLLRSLPYTEGDRLAVVWEHRKSGAGNPQNVINLGNFYDWKDQNTVFADMAAFFDRNVNLTGDGEPEEVPWQVSNELRQRHGRFARAVARLKPGVTFEQAQNEMNVIAARLEQQYPEFDTKWGVNVVPLRTQFTGDIRKPLFILLGAVGFVLLIACANVGNLLLAGASSGRKEIAVSAGLGACGWVISDKLLTESLLLS